MMLRFAFTSDKLPRTTARQWRGVALDLLHMISTWREDPEDHEIYLERYAGRDNAREGLAWMFGIFTTELTQTANSLSVDPRSLQAFYDAVKLWSPELDAEFPDEGRLSEMFGSANATLLELEDGTDHPRAVKECSKPSDGSIVPPQWSRPLTQAQAGALAQTLTVADESTRQWMKRNKDDYPNEKRGQKRVYDMSKLPSELAEYYRPGGTKKVQVHPGGTKKVQG